MSERPPIGRGAGRRQAWRKRRKTGGFGETIKVIVQALLIALVVRTLLFQPFNIPSGSLIPTLLIGDYLFVSKYSYGYSQLFAALQPARFSAAASWPATPKRGDIAVFKLPRDGSTDYIKRVIGLPGDTVQMIEGRLYINGQIVAARAVDERAHARRLRPRADQCRPIARRCPAASRTSIIERDGDRGFYDNTPRLQGAARPLLHDGRQSRQFDGLARLAGQDGGVGYVPFENFVGRAEIIFFSVEEGEPRLAVLEMALDRALEPAVLRRSVEMARKGRPDLGELEQSASAMHSPIARCSSARSPM